MEVEKEITIPYPAELKEYLLEKIAKSPFKLQENAYKDVLDWISNRKIVEVVTVDVDEPYEQEEQDWRD